MRKCEGCGANISPSFVKSGANVGKKYYRKWCDECLLRVRRNMARSNYKKGYEKNRKHREATCIVCGEKFEIGGKGGRGANHKTCSFACYKENMRKVNYNMGLSKNLCTEKCIEARSKTMAGRSRKTKGLMADEHNIHGRMFHLTSPDGVDYEGSNIAHFVRTNAELFSPEDVRVKKRIVGRHRTKTRCNASNGLSMVSRGVRGSWKGWTVTTRHLEDNRRRNESND